jgi:hypothetical protein
MIVFNTKKKAEHWVKWFSKTNDWSRDGYDWESHETYILDNLVVQRHSGDGCGCGCDNYRFNHITILGRIKKWNTKTTRAEKINDLGIKS